MEKYQFIVIILKRTDLHWVEGIFEVPQRQNNCFATLKYTSTRCYLLEILVFTETNKMEPLLSKGSQSS
jgi:hypothetical protein